jgi:hypothetical protein
VEAELIPNVDRWEEECVQHGREVDAKALAKKAMANPNTNPYP